MKSSCYIFSEFRLRQFQKFGERVVEIDIKRF